MSLDDRGYDFGASEETKAWRDGRGCILFVLAVIMIVVGLAAAAFGLTPPERKKVQLALDAVNQGLEQNMNLRYEVAQAKVDISTANSLASSAWASAFEVGLKAKKALDEAERCQKENAEMRPIVAQWNKLQGPWWFRGLNGLFYFAGKSFLSLVLLIVVGFVLFLIIKFALTAMTGGTGAGLGAVTGIFGAFWRWLGRAGKRFLSFFRRRGERAVDNIRHRTMGSDDDDI